MEGADLGVSYWISKEACQKLCNDKVGCNSFTHCNMGKFEVGDCWLKDKLFKQEEASKDTSSGNKCTTYFKSGNSSIL